MNQKHRLASPAHLLKNEKPFGEISLGWNEEGLAFAVEVKGKSNPIICDSKNPTESDGIQIWLDTRNTQNIHRASRYCHYFCVLPQVEKKNGKAIQVVPLTIPRAREDAETVDVKKILAKISFSRQDYTLKLWFPGEQLYGWDPEANPYLGFYYHLKDAELGDQYLSVGEEFPVAHDPSLWSTLELVR